MRLGVPALGMLVLSAAALGGACSGPAAEGASGRADGSPEGGTPGAPSPDVEAGPPSLCRDGKPVEWPAGPYEIGIMGTLPPGLAFQSGERTVALRDYFEPCAERSRLLVIRASAAWCGTCAWNLAHTKRLLREPPFASRLVLLDLVVGDEDNMPPDAAALDRVRAKIDAPDLVAADPRYTFAPALLSRSPLPEYVLVDTRTMVVRNAFGDPSPETLHSMIEIELADLDGAPRPEVRGARLVDGVLEEQQYELVRGMALVAAPPPDPTNEFADDPAAAALGKELFGDPRLSPVGVSCAKCHDAAAGFADRLPQSVGAARVDRNSPSVALAAHARWQFWDGRADTLWAQALGPPENGKEGASSRLYIAHRVAEHYRANYAAVFSKYPLPSNLASLPPAGKPGDAAYDALPAADKDAVTRVYVNVGKAIAAFERTIRVRPNALDRYAAGDHAALSPPQKAALKTFFVAGCAQCHWGPRLTDDAFHVLRFPTGRVDMLPDPGRSDVLAGLRGAEFLASSTWSDAPSAARPFSIEATPSMVGAFKTPPLRGVARTPPFGHGGTFRTLLEVANHYGRRGDEVRGDRTVGAVEPWVPPFDVNAQRQLPLILDVMSAEPEP